MREEGEKRRGEQRRGEALRSNATTNGFPGRLIPPDPHKIITLLHPTRFLFRLYLSLASIFLPLDLLIFNLLIR